MKILKAKLIQRLIFFFLPKVERLNKKFSLVGDLTFFESSSFPWVENLERNWKVILKDLERVLEEREVLPNFQDISPDQMEITQDDKWKTFILYAYGHSINTNLNICHSTSLLLKSIPGMKTAFFSILSPNKHIPQHRGPYNGVLRYHLGLIIPKDEHQCKIRVEQDYSHWVEGKSLVFDDSYLHEVWNNSTEERTVLFVDFLRPLPFPYSMINSLMVKLISFSPLVATALENLRILEENKNKE